MESRRALEQERVIGGHSAPLARRDRLIDLHAVNPDVAYGADRPALIACTLALSAVFNYANTVLARDRKNAVQVSGTAQQVRHQNGFVLASDLALDVGWVDVERLVDFGEHRKRSGQYDGVIAGVPGPGGQNHLVAGTDLQGSHGALQRSRPRGDCQGVAGLYARRELLLKGCHLHGRLLTRAIPTERASRREHVRDLLLLLFVVILRAPKIGFERLGSHRGPAGDSQLRFSASYGHRRSSGQ